MDIRKSNAYNKLYIVVSIAILFIKKAINSSYIIPLLQYTRAIATYIYSNFPNKLDRGVHFL